MVCGADDSLGLCFTDCAGGVEARVMPSLCWQGYQGVLHGGMISTLLDAAMTHCLFALGVEAMTAELRVRFLKSTPCDRALRLRARLLSRRRGLFHLSAELEGAGECLARAEAKFLARK